MIAGDTRDDLLGKITGTASRFRSGSTRTNCIRILPVQPALRRPRHRSRRCSRDDSPDSSAAHESSGSVDVRIQFVDTKEEAPELRVFTPAVGGCGRCDRRTVRNPGTRRPARRRFACTCSISGESPIASFRKGGAPTSSSSIETDATAYSWWVPRGDRFLRSPSAFRAMSPKPRSDASFRRASR